MRTISACFRSRLRRRTERRPRAADASRLSRHRRRARRPIGQDGDGCNVVSVRASHRCNVVSVVPNIAPEQFCRRPRARAEPQSRGKANSSRSPSRNTFGSSQELVRAWNLPSRPRVKMIVWSSAFRMTVRSFFCFGTKKTPVLLCRKSLQRRCSLWKRHRLRGCALPPARASRPSPRGNRRRSALGQRCERRSGSCSPQRTL